MKTKINVLFLMLAVVFAAVLTSCEDDDDSDSAKDIFTSKTWTFDKIETNSTDETIQSLVQFTGAALTGATVSATADGNYTMTVLGESESGTWSLSDDEKFLTIDPPDEDAWTVELITITSSSVVWEEDVTDDLGTYTLTYYWK